MKNNLIKFTTIFLIFICIIVVGKDAFIKVLPSFTKDPSVVSLTDEHRLGTWLTDTKSVLVWATHENYYTPASLAYGLDVWNQIEQKTNVTIKWDILPREQYDVDMQIKLLADERLPDLMVVPGYDPTQYGQNGILIPLEELIQKYAPNIQKIFKEYPESKELMTSADNHIYGLAPIVQGSMDTLQPTFCIRKDWLDKLGLNEPVTLQDWYTVLKAFKMNDMNMNGKNDEIPFLNSPEFFSEAFGLQLMSGSDYIENNGKVKYQWADTRMKEYLYFAKKLYQEGLIDQSYGSISADTPQSKVIKNKVGSYVSYPDWISSWQKQLNSNSMSNARYVPILPPKGAQGECSVDTTNVIDKRFSGITRDCKDPIIAIKFLDYLWSDEGIRYMAWGIEGKTYTIDKGKLSFTDYVTNNSNGLGMSDALRTVGAWPTIPWVQQREQYVEMLSLEQEFKKLPEMIKPYLKVPFPMLLANKEEQEHLMILESDISNYTSEMMVKFITGKEPVENFSDYTEALKSMGLDELLEIKQTQYDRFQKMK